MKNYLILIGIAICAASCSPSRFVEPLHKGEQAVNFETGGPLIKYGNATIPVPLSSFTYGYGWKDSLTVFGGIHTTAMLFGVMQTDIGAVKQIMTQKKYVPSVSVTPVANFAFDIWEHHFKFWPEVDANAYWHYGKRGHFCYVGVANWFELASKGADERKQTTHWVYNPEIGNTFIFGKWNYNLELKYLAPNHDRLPNVVEYQGPGKKGAFGVYIGLTRRF